MSITIREVAKAANVSVGTVSRVLNGHPTVSPENAERVLKVVEELRYKPLRVRAAESGLASLRDANIALLLLGMNRTLASLPCVADAIHDAEAALNEAGANLLLADLPLADRVPPMLERNRIDGVLLKGALQGDLFGGGNPALFDRLRELPTVWFLGRPDGGDWGDVAQSNDWQAGRLAAEHLLARGHRRLAVLNPKPGHVTFRQREASFTWHARRAGAAVTAVLGRPTEEWELPLRPVDQVGLVAGLVDELLGADLRPTAVFVPGDSVTAMIYRALAERGLRVGRDLSLVSCNHEPPILAGLFPTPTTIDIHAEQIGRRAVDQLAWRLAHDQQAGLDVGVAPTLVDGGSVAEV
ncbi:MAG TPA: LacI family DNA-binding transcriptional regulator [Gemmataceae bacterium]|jgi:DNA-binding LacI/PurR family transcriptional regulator